MPAAVGIDLGTTNSVVAISQGGRPRVLTGPDGAPLIPSVVSFHPNGQAIVGAAARARRPSDPTNTVFSVKRLLGRPYASEEVRRARSRFAFELREGPDAAILVHTRAGDLSLPEISALVLREIRRVAEAALGESVERAVVTVPANFNELQRTGTKVAGQIADLDVIRILNEPTAAALAYGYGRGAKERIAVYDFGGGTFDVTILELSGNVFEVLATAGDTFLGGDDIDLLITENLADAVFQNHRIDARQDPRAFELLRAAAEQAKIDLSSAMEATVRIPEIGYAAGGRPMEFRTRIARPELERLAAPLVGRTFEVCGEALKLASLKPQDCQTVILVGGSSRIPAVRDGVARYFGRDPLTTLPPEQVVGLGAAILAEALTGGARKTRVSQPPAAQPGVVGVRSRVQTLPPNLPPVAQTPGAQPGRPVFAQTKQGVIPSRPPPAGDSRTTTGEYGKKRFTTNPGLSPAVAPAGSSPLRAVTRPGVPGVTPSAAPGVSPARPSDLSWGSRTAAPLHELDDPATTTIETVTREPAPTSPSLPSFPAVEAARPGAPANPPSLPAFPAIDPQRPDTAPSLPAFPAVNPSRPDPSQSLPAFPAVTPDSSMAGDEEKTGSYTRANVAQTVRGMRGAQTTSADNEPTNPRARGPASTPGEITRPRGQLPPNDEVTRPRGAPPAPPTPPIPFSRPGTAPLDEETQFENTQPNVRANPPAAVPPTAARSRTIVNPAAPPPLSDASKAAWDQTLLAPPTNSAGPLAGVAPRPPSMPPPPEPPPPPSGGDSLFAMKAVRPSMEPAARLSDPPASMQPPSLPPLAPPLTRIPSVQPPPTARPLSFPPPGPASNPPPNAGGLPLLLDVTPHSLGIETVGGMCEAVIPRNATIPVEHTREFATSYDGQEAVRIRIAQGESRRFGENQPLGELELSGITRAARGEVRIDVTFELDADGTLQVRAREAGTGRETQTRVMLLTMPSAHDAASMAQRQRTQA